MFVLVLVSGLIGQSDDVARGPQSDRRFIAIPVQREIYEATMYAKMWTMHSLPQEKLFSPMMNALEQACYRQIAEAYDVTIRVVNDIVRDRSLRRIRFVPINRPRTEAEDSDKIRMRVSPWSNRRTLFDPSKVKLDKRLKRAIEAGQR